MFHKRLRKGGKRKELEAAENIVDKLLKKVKPKPRPDPDTPLPVTKLKDPGPLDLRARIKECYFSPKEGGKPRPLDELWDGQEKVLAIIEEALDSGEPLELVIHKSRRVGVTLIVLAAYCCIIKHYIEMHAVELAHLDDVAEDVFRYVKRFHDYFPPSEVENKPLEGGKVHKSFLQYKAPHSSRFSVCTSKTIEALRGLTIQLLALTEGGMTRDLKEVLSGGLPAAEGAWIKIVEGTAKGKTYFYTLCQMAKDPESNWRFLFLGWPDDRRSALPIEDGEEFVLDQDEEKYVQEHLEATGVKLTLQQMKWARDIRKRLCLNSLEIFNQEYPSFSERAFDFSGHPWFNRKKTSDNLSTHQEPIFRGNISFISQNRILTKLDPETYGALKIWAHPDPQRAYYMGVDISHGIGSDYAEIVVLDDLGSQVAHFRSNRIEPSETAVTAIQIGYYYYTAELAIERNGPGLAAIDVAKMGHVAYPQLQGEYPNLYYETKTDRRELEETKVAGFGTSRKSKDRILDVLKSDYNSGRIKINSLDLLLQMDGYSWDPDTKKWYQNYQAPGEKQTHDDGIMALAIANDRRQGTRIQSYVKKSSVEVW